MPIIMITLTLLTLLISIAHAVFLAPVSRAFLPGNVHGAWDLDPTDSSTTCPTSIRHFGYRQTVNPSVFKILHIDMSHDTISCEGTGAMAIISSAVLLDKTTHVRIPADVLRPFTLYLLSDKDYMLTAARLAAAGHAFYGLVELTARDCGSASRFELGTKGFFLANSTSDPFNVPPFKKALVASKKHMTLYEGGEGGRRCLYSAELDVLPLQEPVNAIKEPEPTPAPLLERPVEDTPAPNASIPVSPTPARTPQIVEESGGSFFSDIQDANTTSAGRACFPAAARVLLSSGQHIRMDQLIVGDHVHIGQGLYSRVFMFTHKDPYVIHPFVRLVSISSHQLELSPGHFIYLNGRLRPASTANIGDELMLADGSKTTITSIQTVQNRGLYNPQTLTGDIVVNNVIVSCYTTAVHPRVAHSLLAPLRAVCHALTSPLST